MECDKFAETEVNQHFGKFQQLHPHPHPYESQHCKFQQLEHRNTSSQLLKSTNFGGVLNYQILILCAIYLHGSLLLR